MKRWTIRLLVLALLIAGWFAAKGTVLKPKPVTVEVHEVSRGVVESTVTNTRAGTITARRRAHVSAEIGGLVIELPFAEGDRVERGDLLLRLDGSIQEAQLELTRRQVGVALARQAETQLVAQRAERELQRNARLFEQNLISDDVLDQLTSQRDRALLGVATSEAMVVEARAQESLMETRILQGELHAPFAGILAQLKVEVGEFVTPSPPGIPIPSVIDLIDPTSIYIRAPMDEVDSAVIQVGMPVRVTIDPFEGREFEAQVVRIAPYVLDMEKQNRTLDIEVELKDKEFAGRLLPGTSADVEVILTTAEDIVRIPTSCLLEGGRVLLFEQGVLVERKVEVGLRNWNWTSIVSGLEVGEHVVTTLGSSGIADGALAQLAEQAGE